MASIYDVTHWLTIRGVTHIVAARQSGWSHTLCGSLISCEPTTTKPFPMRLCRKCKAELATARVEGGSSCDESDQKK